MKVETRFNVGDKVFIVNERIEEKVIKNISIEANSWKSDSTYIEYEFEHDSMAVISGIINRPQDEVFATVEEALEFLKNNVEKDYVR